MAALFRRSPSVAVQCTYQRPFSTSSSRVVSLQWDKNDPEALAQVLPPYPHGPTRWYKQSRLGLYGGQRIQFGNNVSGKFDTKTRRTWQPNIFTKKLFSRSLNRHVQVRVSTRVLRTIDKVGGLDEYLLGEKEARIKELGESGWWLRWAIMQTPAIKKRFALERTRLGITKEGALAQANIGADVMASSEEAASAEAEMDAAAEEAEGEFSLADTDPIAMDDTFKIEQNADLPIIKFRVGPGQHVVLTPNGWRRTRPVLGYHAKKAIADGLRPTVLDKPLKKLRAELEGNEELAELERSKILRKKRQELRADLERQTEEIFTRKYEDRKLLKTKRRAAKRAASQQTAESNFEAIL